MNQFVFAFLAAILLVPTALFSGLILEKVVKGREAKYLSRFTIVSAILLFAWAFLPLLPDWVRAVVATYSSISLAFWLQAKVTDFLEWRKYRSFALFICNELRGNKDLLKDLLDEYVFALSPDPAVWDLIKVRNEAFEKKVGGLRGNVYDSLLATGLTYYLPSDDTANELEKAYSTISGLKSTTAEVTAGVQLKLAVVKSCVPISVQTLEGYTTNIQKDLENAKEQIVWAYHYTSTALDYMVSHLPKDLASSYEVIENDPADLTPEEVAAKERVIL